MLPLLLLCNLCTYYKKIETTCVFKDYRKVDNDMCFGAYEEGPGVTSVGETIPHRLARGMEPPRFFEGSKYGVLYLHTPGDPWPFEKRKSGFRGPFANVAGAEVFFACCPKSPKYVQGPGVGRNSFIPSGARLNDPTTLSEDRGIPKHESTSAYLDPRLMRERDILWSLIRDRDANSCDVYLLALVLGVSISPEVRESRGSVCLFPLVRGGGAAPRASAVDGIRASAVDGRD